MNELPVRNRMDRDLETDDLESDELKAEMMLWGIEDEDRHF